MEHINIYCVGKIKENYLKEKGEKPVILGEVTEGTEKIVL